MSRLGRAQEAEMALRTTLKYAPEFVPALFELGALLHRTGRIEEAEKKIRQVLKQVPSQAHAELALAAILVDDNRPTEAEEASLSGRVVKPLLRP